MNKKIVLATAITTIVTSGSVANAAEFKSSLYLGLSGDVYQDATQKHQSTNDFGDGYKSIYKDNADEDTDFTIGAHIGYDKLFVLGGRKFVIGAELGGSANGPEGSTTENWSGTYYETSYDKGDYYDADEEVDYTTESTTKNEVDWSGEFRIKLGYLPLPNLMVYAFGGPVIAHATETVKTHSIDTHIDSFDGSEFVEETNDTERTGQFGFGYLVGAGIDWMAWENVSVRAEAFYSDISFDSDSYSEGDYKSSSETTHNGVVARMAITYHFDF